MPRLLPFDALAAPPHDGGPSERARWTAILAVALLLTASVTDWPDTWDTVRGLLPAQAHRSEWTAADLDTAFDAERFPGDYDGLTDPAAAGDAQLRAQGVLLDLVWDPTLTIATVRVETYTDAFGTGFRLGIAADTTTAAGIACLNARITTLDSAPTTAQWCSRADRHEPVDMAAFLGKDGDDGWAADQLYVTQTANLTPPAGTRRLADFYGFGITTGNANDTGLWPRNYWQQGENSGTCDDPRLRQRLDDLHLTDRYADPSEHQLDLEHLHTSQSAYPVEHRLLAPACAPIAEGHSEDWITAGPFLTGSPTPMAATYPFNASTRETRPMRIAFVVDLRTCDTGITYCTSDDASDVYWVNSGVGATWMTDLLEPPERPAPA